MLVEKIPWYLELANFVVCVELSYDYLYNIKKKLMKYARYYYWDKPYLFKIYAGGIIRR